MIIKRILVFILSTLLLSSCNNFLKRDPTVSFNNGNALQIKIDFETAEPDSVRIVFWEKNNPTKKRFSKSSYGTNHSLVLLNFTSETHYTFQINTLSSNKYSKEFAFSTGKLPEDLISIQKFSADTSVFSGYLFVRRFYKSGADFILDNGGNIVWYHPYNAEVRRAFAWTSRKTIISITDTSRVTELDLEGKVLNEIDFVKKGNPRFVHHEVLLDNNNKIVALKTDSVLVDLKKSSKGESSMVRFTGIIRADFSGAIEWEWSLKDHTPENELVNPDGTLKRTVGHANSIYIDTDGNYIVSFRDFSQIWKINSLTGEVLWKLGKQGDFKMDEEAYFIRQHSAHITPYGDLLMFDNGEHKLRPLSRVVGFKLDEQKLTAETTHLLTLPKGLTSYRMCSAYMIDEGKYLICTTRKDGQLVVMNTKGKVLWKVVMNHATYRAYYLDDPFGEIN